MSAAFRQLVLDISAEHEPGYTVGAQDIRALTDAELAVILHEDDALLVDGMRAVTYADILDSVLHISNPERTDALGQQLREDLTRECRRHLAQCVNEELERVEAAAVEVPNYLRRQAL